MNYQEFLKQKQKLNITSGFDLDENKLNPNLFDFQKYIVKKALKNGKYAIFADCGLGKTLMQLEWAYQVSKKTNSKILILAPLAVKGQTIDEAKKFNIDIVKYSYIFKQHIYKHANIGDINIRKNIHQYLLIQKISLHI